VVKEEKKNRKWEKWKELIWEMRFHVVGQRELQIDPPVS